MQNCCIEGCESSKFIGTKNIVHFKFPVNNENLLKRWLKQMDQSEWKPTKDHLICSQHFRDKDFDSRRDRVSPTLKPSSIPTIFPNPSVNVVDNIRNRTESRTNPIQFPLQTVDVDNRLVLIATEYPAQFPMELSTRSSCLMRSQISMQNLTATRQNSARNVGQSMQNCWQNPVQSSKQNLNRIIQNCTRNPIRLPIQNSARILQRTAHIHKIPIESPSEKCTTISTRIDNLPNISKSSMEPLFPIQSRLRKILPKPEVSVAKTSKSEMIPPIVKLPISYRKTRSKTLSPAPLNKKRPILRISISKTDNRSLLKKSRAPCNENEASSELDELSKQTISKDNVALSQKEITIVNSSTNKSVTFKLHPITGEIIVTTHELKKSSRDEDGAVSSRTRGKSNNACNRSPVVKLNHLYTKAQQDCKVLKNRLKLLRQRHKKEQREINKLQEHLAELDNKVVKSCNENTLESRDCKEKRTSFVESENDENYERLLEQVREIKHDFEKTRKDLSTRSNGVDLVSANEQDSGNEEPAEITRISSDGEIIGEIDDNYGEICKEIKQDSCGEGDSGSEEAYYKTEFLESEFLTG